MEDQEFFEGFLWYCETHAQTHATILALEEKFSPHKQQEEIDSGNAPLDLASLMLEPVQRITRYPLLIKQVRTRYHIHCLFVCLCVCHLDFALRRGGSEGRACKGFAKLRVPTNPPQ